MTQEKALYSVGIGRESENLAKHYSRAKYAPDAGGGLRLISVQHMSLPVFGEAGYEEARPARRLSVFDDTEGDEAEGCETPDAAANAARAARRAQVSAFDYIICNPALDAFGTFTFDPARIAERAEYEACYEALRPWVSNRVQRSGLKYIVCPERHKAGGIHFHMIFNSSAVDMVRARNAKTGRAMSHNGNPLFNIPSWGYGFTSAEVIRQGNNDRNAVAKYILKYMSKQGGQRIGGRYFLHGGDLAKPFYVYADDPADLADLSTATRVKVCDKIGDTEGISYREWSFI